MQISGINPLNDSPSVRTLSGLVDVPSPTTPALDVGP